MLVIRLLSFCLLIVTAACATPSTQFMPSSAALAHYAPTDPQQIDILHSNPKKPFIELGGIRADAYLVNPDAQMLYYMKREAARHGAHAIILYKNVEQHDFVESAINMTPPKYASAIAIRYE